MIPPHYLFWVKIIISYSNLSNALIAASKLFALFISSIACSAVLFDSFFPVLTFNDLALTLVRSDGVTFPTSGLTFLSLLGLKNNTIELRKLITLAKKPLFSAAGV